MPPTKTNLKFSELAGEECVKMFLEGDFGKATVFLQEGNSYKVGRAPLEKVRIPRHLRPCGFIEYENLKATASFVDYYRPLFGEPVKKDEIVYKNMLKY
jgi:hypothetical protein